MNTEPFVSFDNIAKRWNGQLGVENISIDIPEGAFVALLGPSGCGKSTTLRLLAGLEIPDEGAIRIEGTDVTEMAPSARNLSMVFQSYALFPHLSVAENVMFGMKVRKVPKDERLKKLENALRITGLLGYEERKPGELSGGQRQRVALARAIVAGQPLCLMDEPLSNLDAKLRHSVRKDIKKLQKDLGMTVVYVTHDQTEAMSMADLIILMKDGHIMQAGTPQELYNIPQNTFAAEFIGAPPMALIDGDVIPGTEHAHKVGLRTEDVELVEAGQGRISCTVSESEYLGDETHVLLDHPKAKGLVVKLHGYSSLEEGSTVDITFEDSALHFFDGDGKRIN
ncbi:ABC transporter ATP-binding protein [Grimontia sp. AD028]|uniref:Glycerol-3-phosphate ABC transporter, ATP-binding protein UgpC n=1 Tax=Grimontia indica TaxID=1056512 RepID=R1IWK5_9GAMM|nr:MULTISPECIES: ABC transporter ATP-binding protein [Grimontia]EOD79680.1 Glycerol-3-phosphate ABC transporter, ATP-binding protein UgpC [Grimontia indica]KKD58645.1 ABC transporter ATP-binding protein [Grimontia sp. AD028]